MDTIQSATGLQTEGREKKSIREIMIGWDEIVHWILEFLARVPEFDFRCEFLD